MVYLFNTNLESNKKVRIALKNIYGIGDNIAYQICDQIGISEKTKIKQLTNFQLEKVASLINQNKSLGADLKQQKRKNVQRLVKIACYKGFRHTEGLPCRGQRTHGNSKTSRRIRSSFLISK